MATANKTVVTTTAVTLTLSAEEAQVLAGVLGYVGGDPDGPRGLLDNILDALSTADLFWDDHVQAIHGSLTVQVAEY